MARNLHGVSSCCPVHSPVTCHISLTNRLLLFEHCTCRCLRTFDAEVQRCCALQGRGRTLLCISSDPRGPSCPLAILQGQSPPSVSSSQKKLFVRLRASNPSWRFCLLFSEVSYPPFFWESSRVEGNAAFLCDARRCCCSSGSRARLLLAAPHAPPAFLAQLLTC